PEPAEARYYNIETKPRFDFYIYWMGMAPGCSGTCWYGNQVINDTSVNVTVNGWMCVEVMLKLNSSLSTNNGELAMWINGTLIAQFAQGTFHDGFQWRSDASVKNNWLRLIHYDSVDSTGRIRFDDLVVAKSYIGPLNTGSTSTTTAPIANPLDSVKVYPNPCKLTGSNNVKISKLTSTSAVKIFSANGEFIKSFDTTDLSYLFSDDSYTVCWNGKNTDGIEVPRGVYFLKVTDQNGNEKSKKVVVTK
ncbi:MAG: T9SS type A sorting domain-containing protein, partial [Candidatus Firestonebacteria bacterium]